MTSRAGAIRWRDVALPALLMVATLLISGRFASGGGFSGFINMGHDGYNLQEMVDLEHGGTVFKDTYEQYGPLGPYLNLAGFELFGRRLLALRYTMCLIYGLTAFVLYRAARHLLGPGLSAFSGIAWLSLAPFYQQGIMISVHVYILLFQALATLALLNFVDSSELWLLVVAGLSCGLSCVLKQSVGFLFSVAIGLYFLLRAARRPSTWLAEARNLAIVGVSAVAVVAATLGFLWMRGALHDWYLQSILFPKQFYLGVQSVGEPAGGSLLNFPADFIHAHIREGVTFEWYAMRAVLAVGLVVALLKHRSADRAIEKLVLTACLTLVLWAAAYPSAAIMHQWWTLSIGIAACVYCVRSGAAWLLARRPARVPSVTVLTVCLLLAAGVRDRVNAAVVRQAAPSATIAEPWLVAGVKTDPQTRDDLRLLLSTIANYRRHHPGTRLVSIDASDGWMHGVAESILWLPLVGDNPHPHPVYWSMPVLSTETYPGYQAQLTDEIQRTHPLLGEARLLPYSPLRIEGYYLLLAIQTSRGEVWYVYAPAHPDSERHAEVTTLSHVEFPKAKPPAQPVASAPAEITPAPISEVGELAQQAIASGEAVLRAVKPVRPEGRDLYRWPRDLDVSETPPQAVEPVNDQVMFLEQIVTLDRTGWTVDGQARQPLTYLLSTSERDHRRGATFIARGELLEGGLALGLQQHERWVGEVAISRPGRFIIVLEAPEDGPYAVVLSNNLSTHVPASGRMLRLLQLFNRALLRNRFRVTSAGWTK